MTNLCPQCSAPIPADSPLGFCPQCMLAVGAGESEAASRASGDGTDAPPTPEEIQPLFPHLQIIRVIGQGGMGAVYEAKQRGLGRTIALKVLWAPKNLDAAFEQRFAREGEALAQLSHDHIVTVHDAGKSGPYYWLVMEYVEGANLRELLEQGRLAPEQALPMVGQICTALEYAHQQGIVHRDIKPENILIGRDGHVKVADFGLAKMLTSDRKGPMLTQSFLRLGTPHYMAPEQLETPKEVDHRADIYSLGVVLYELLTGELPIGKFDLPSRAVGVDPRLDGVVSKAMQKSPSRRYQAISDIQRAVQNIADSHGRPHSSKRRSSDSSATRLPVSVALVAAVVAACFFAWQYFEGSRNAQAAARTLDQYYREALVKVQSPAQRREGIVSLEYVLQQDPERRGLTEALRDACRQRAEDLIQQHDPWNALRSARRADELAQNAGTQSTLASAASEAREDLQDKVLFTSPRRGSVLNASSCLMKGSVPQTIKGEIAINGRQAEKSANGEFHVQLDGLSEGTNMLTLSVAEEDGLVVSMPIELRVDTKDPELIIATPVERAIVRAPITLTGTVRDGSAATVTCEGATTKTEASGAWSLTVESVPEGEQSLTVIATDAASNRKSQRWTLVVDNTKPEVHIDGDRLDFAARNSGVEVRLRVSDGHLSRVTADGVSLGLDDDGNAKCFALAGALEGESRVTAILAVDHAGNERSVNVSVRKDTTKPAIRLDTDSVDLFPGSLIHLSGAVDDDSECEVSLGDGVVRVLQGRFDAPRIMVPRDWKPKTPFLVRGDVRDAAENTTPIEVRYSISKPCENCQPIDGRRGDCRKCSGLRRRIEPCKNEDCRNNPNGEGLDLCSVCDSQFADAPECRVCGGDGKCTQCGGTGHGDRTQIDERRVATAAPNKNAAEARIRSDAAAKLPAIFDTELVLNGDCEQVAVAGGIPQWEIVNGDWIPVEVGPGMRDARSGTYFFRPIGKMAIEEIRQDIDISAAWKRSANGSVVVHIGARVCGHYQGGAGDESQVVVEFLDRLNRSTGAPIEYGPAWSAPWFNVELSGDLPKDTRKLRVRLIARRHRGTLNDGYFDNISVKLSDVPR